MAFCSNCGTAYEEGAKFCPSCGAAVGQEQPTQQPQPQQSVQPAQPQYQQPQGAAQNDFVAKLQSLNNTADTTAQFDKTDIEQNKVMAILAYLSWLVLVPLFGAKESRFARFHVNQGIVLAIVETAWWIVEVIISAIFSAISWRLGALVGTLLGIVNLVFLVFLIIGIMNAANGKAKELPIIGKFRIIK